MKYNYLDMCRHLGYMKCNYLNMCRFLAQIKHTYLNIEYVWISGFNVTGLSEYL